MDLDWKDKKILAEYYHNYRDSLKSIASDLRLSADVVRYRVNKYEETGLIKKYVTLFNYPKLGFNEFKIVWLSCNDRAPIRKDLRERPYVLTYGDMLSQYNIFINFVFKDKQHAEEELNKFIRKHEENITNYDVFTTTGFEFHSLKSFADAERETSFNAVTPAEETVDLDDVDREMIQILEEDGSTSVTEMSQELNMSASGVLKRLRQLEEDVIAGRRIYLDMEKLGYFWAELHVKLDALDKSLKAKLRTWCKEHPQVNLLTLGTGRVNAIVQYFYREEPVLRASINDFYDEFSTHIVNSELILTENEGNVRTMWFPEK